jgi:hypothetical protein
MKNDEGRLARLSISAHKLGSDPQVLWSNLGFEVRAPTGRRLHAFLVRLEGEAAAWVSKQRGESSRADRAVWRWAVGRIEALLRDPTSAPSPKSADSDAVELILGESDLPLLSQLVGAKRCDYQVRDGPDVFCSAAWQQADKTIVETQGHRALAPTSRALCLKCELPDSDFICSHLHHPKVTGSIVSGLGQTPPTFRRQLCGAFCDLDRPELETGARCHPGGNSCWERLISGDEAKASVPYSPRDLPIALDFLNMVWAEAFPKSRLLQLKSAEGVAGLVLPCGTRDEFAARLSELADVLKLFNVPDELLPDAKRTLDKSATLDRLVAALDRRFPEYDSVSVTRASAVLRAINKARWSLQHSGAAADFPSALAQLGMEYPILNYAEAWNAIRTKAAEAVTAIRRAIQTAIS